MGRDDCRRARARPSPTVNPSWRSFSYLYSRLFHFLASPLLNLYKRADRNKTRNMSTLSSYFFIFLFYSNWRRKEKKKRGKGIGRWTMIISSTMCIPFDPPLSATLSIEGLKVTKKGEKSMYKNYKKNHHLFFWIHTPPFFYKIQYIPV